MSYLTGLFTELNETDNFVDDILLNDSENNFKIIRDKNGNILGLDTNDSIVDTYLYSILEKPNGSGYIEGGTEALEIAFEGSKNTTTKKENSLKKY